MMQRYDLLGHGIVKAGLIQGVGDAGRLITVGGGNYCPLDGIADAEIGAYLIVPEETGDYLVMDAETFTAHATLVEAASEGRDERQLGVGGAVPSGEPQNTGSSGSTSAPDPATPSSPNESAASGESSDSSTVEPPADVSQD
jgi:hypothetical protein